MTSIVDKLVQLGQTLSNSDVAARKKIKVLKTLDEIDLNLNELSSSGIGKAVKSLRNEPDDLGQLSKSLIQKWKRTLEEHLAKEKLNNNLSPKPSNTFTLENKINNQDPVPDQNAKYSSTTQQNTTHKPPPKKVLMKKADSIDATSGMSFMESLTVQAPKKKSLKRKLPESINVDLENDYIRNRINDNQINPRTEELEDDPEFEAGNLKYKSQKVLYAGRKSGGEHLGQQKVLTLVQSCVHVLGLHIHQVDHVGSLPFEIFEKALVNVTINDLVRIQKFNPQFKKELQPHWIKMAVKDFPLVNFDKLMKENPDILPCHLYKRLTKETEHKLEKFINRTSNKARAEKDAQRTTLTTEAIAPHNRNKRFSHQMPAGRFSTQSSSISRSNSSANQLFIPKNMSHPNGLKGLLPSASSVPTRPSQNAKAKPASGGDLLAKLRKKFR